jgi:hypothetical protein
VRRVCVLLSVALITGGVGLTPGADSRQPARVRTAAVIDLKVVYVSGLFALGPLTYRLGCYPASGTMPHAKSVCAAIVQRPGMVLSGPGQSHSCPFSTLVTISGNYRGQRIAVTFSPCLSRQEDFTARWLSFLPSYEDLTRVRVDHGLGPLNLGSPASSARDLLGTPQAETDGLAVYEPGWSSGFRQTVRAIFAVGYGHGRVTTLVDNSPSLTIYGEQQPFTARSGPRLRRWRRVRCDGVSALASHAFRGGEATTIIRPSVDHPVVIVTSTPKQACAAAARL